MMFPLYRKYPSGTSFFEILSAEEFKEIQLIGDRYEIHHIKASILPERNYLLDLIENREGRYIEMSGDEFQRELSAATEQRKPLG